MPHLVRFVLAVAAIGAAATPAVANANATDPGTAEGGTIVMIADSPPSLAGSFDLRLLDTTEPGVSVDITDDKCGPLEATAASPIPTRRCEGLDDASYFVDAVDVPSDQAYPLPIACTDPQGQSDESGGISIDERDTEWECTVTIAAPGVVIDLVPDVAGGMELEVFDLEIVNANGDVVSDDCELDERYGAERPRRWCFPLPEGNYDARAIGVPDDVMAEAECSRISAGRGGSPSFSIIVEDQPVFFRCTGATQTPSIRWTVDWEGAADFELDPAWVDAMTFSIDDADGNDATSTCRRLEVPSATLIECFGLPDGLYDVELGGLRDDFELLLNCSQIEVIDGYGFCDDTIVYDTAVTTTVATTPPETTTTGPGPVLVGLPETGTPSSNTVMIALLLLGAGSALLIVASRRRTI